jgi:dolichol kinase
MIIGFAFFLGLAIILLIYGRYAVFLGLAIAIIWLIWLTMVLIKDRPVKYNPLDIPSRLLPKVTERGDR